ncbi:MAG: DUF2764 domain-containing protein [Deltaproteobacteria bacterium]|nr:DUF2764 domain-containing protein [Deltaproteobacteria bacterium]
MGRKHYYLLTALPSLMQFGSAPPLGKSEFLTMVRDSGGPGSAVEVLLLGDDLLEREAVLSGEINLDEVDLSVLSAAQASGARPLPEFLIARGPQDEKVSREVLSVDILWGRYFHYAANMADRLGSRFLGDWVAYEVGLRNALARERAATLGLDARPYLVAEELGNPGAVFHRELEAWKRAPDPLAGLEALERVRWQWLEEQTPWYDFGDDEVLAYGAKLLSLLRWRRILRDEHGEKGVS